MTAPVLEYAFGYTGRLKPPIAIGGPYGARTVFELIGGDVTGPDFKGELTPGGGDWMIIGEDGWSRLDVRAQILLDDGVAIFTHYHGFVELNEAVQAWLADDKDTSYEDHYFRTSPRFETSDPRYHWLTTTLFVGVGRLREGRTVEYQVYRVT